MALEDSTTSHTGASNSSSSPIFQVSQLPNIATHLPVKLNASNYLLWQAQLLPLLHSYDLAKHIDGCLQPPPSLTDTNQPNPLYDTWFCQDKLVLSWIIGSIT